MPRSSVADYKEAVNDPDFSLRDRLIAMGVSEVGAHLAFVASHKTLINPRTYPSQVSS